MLGLRRAIYKVGDIREATIWYTKAFKSESYFNEPFNVGFNIGGYELGLQPEKSHTLVKPESVKALWGVEDIQNTYE